MATEVLKNSKEDSKEGEGSKAVTTQQHGTQNLSPAEPQPEGASLPKEDGHVLDPDISSDGKGGREEERSPESKVTTDDHHHKDYTSPPEERPVAMSNDKRFIKYDVEIGRGSFKTVYKGVDTETGIPVAWCELQVIFYMGFN